MIEEQFVSFETAKMLKEAGFDEVCSWAYYRAYKCLIHERNNKLCSGYYSCPTQALAARWLREVHNLHVYAIQTNLPYTEPQTTKWEWGYVIDKIDDPNSNVTNCGMYFDSYEAAFEGGIVKCLELIKK